MGDRAVPLDSLSCIVCGRSAPFEELFESGGFRLVRCPDCGLGFQEPQPDQAELANTYYHDADFSRALFGELRQWTVKQAERKLKPLRGLLPADRPLRVLDVGCSSGAWLEVAERQGWRATGIEIGADTSRAARERGLDVRTGTLADLAPELSGERFDLVSFWDVLEHLPDPRGELALARGLLADDGLLALTLPNLDGLYPRATYRLIGRRRGVWEYPELPVHLYDFTPSTIARLLEDQGLTPVETRTTGVPFAFYRQGTLSLERLGGGARALALRAGFEGLHGLLYPVAAMLGRGNHMFVAARPGSAG